MEIKSEANIKSLEQFLIQLFDKFAYEDFQPPIDKTVLKAKLQEIIGKETPYWKPDELPQSWRENWFAITPKTYSGTMPVSIGISIKLKAVYMVVFDEVHSSAFINNYHQVEVSLPDIWHDHRVLIDQFRKLLNKCQQFALKSPGQTGFKWEE